MSKKIGVVEYYPTSKCYMYKGQTADIKGSGLHWPITGKLYSLPEFFAHAVNAFHNYKPADAIVIVDVSNNTLAYKDHVAIYAPHIGYYWNGGYLADAGAFVDAVDAHIEGAKKPPVYGAVVYADSWEYRGQKAVRGPGTSTSFSWKETWYKTVDEFIKDVNKAYACAESAGLINKNAPDITPEVSVLINKNVVDITPDVSITQAPDGKKKVTVTISID